MLWFIMNQWRVWEKVKDFLDPLIEKVPLLSSLTKITNQAANTLQNTNISTSEKLTSKSKYKAVVNGNNKLYVDVSELGSKNQPIYYKVIWSSNMDKNLTISKPILTLRLTNSVS